MFSSGDVDGTLNRFRSLGRGVAVSLAGLAVTGLALQSASAAETKGYVVNWFYMGSYFGGDSDCPKGLNPTAIDFYRRDFLRLGYTKDQVDALLKGFPGEYAAQPWQSVALTRGNGKDDVFANPTTAPDPGLFPIEGKFAYGFNLDGKGAASPNAFEEPETHEKGVNNQLYRALGCIRTFRSGTGAGARPSYPEYVWEVLRNGMPAWLISVTSDGGKDGDATVTLDRALETVSRDSSGTNVRPDMTFQVDPDPRTHHVLRGTIKDGLFTSSEPADVHFIGDAFGLAPDMHFTSMHLRLKLNPDGSVRGVLGGYQPWYPIYWANASRGTGTEYDMAQDAVAMYYALKRSADADPDPKTGENQAISSSYIVEAVPAFIVPSDNAKPPVRTSQAP